MIDPTRLREQVGETILISGQDVYAAAVAAGEIAPAFENKIVVLAVQMDGKLLGPAHLHLVVSGDKRGGRSVRDVVSIAVLETPALH